MATTLPHLLLFPLFLMPFSTLAQSNGNVTVGKSLIATDKAIPWLSPSEDFAFGFHKLNGTDLFLLSIWFNKIPYKTIVWYANEGKPVPRDSKVELTADRGLLLSDPQDHEVWNTSDTVLDEVAYGFMNDTGNFVLVRSDSVKVWESFKNPTDTMLPTQIMETGGVLFSRLTETNFTRGRFQLRLLQDGNLVLNTRNMETNWAYDAYYISGTYDPTNTTNSGYQVIFNETGYLYILRRNGQRFDLTPTIAFPASDYYHRATFEFDGVFIRYSHPKTFSGSPGWSPSIWSVPDNICVDIGGGKGSGACGYNSVCRLSEYRRPICECPQGYSLLDPNDRYGSCKPNFTESCEEDGSTSVEDVYGIVDVMDTNWPTSDYEQLKPSSEVECKKSCLQDCFCAAAIFGADGCWKKKLPLSNGRKESGTRAFLKYGKGSLPPQTPQPRFPDKKKNHGTLILVESVLLGTSFFVNFVFVVAFCLGFFLIYHKKTIKVGRGDNVVGTNLRCFTYKELAEATNGFKEELGRGSFGIVYQGVIQMGASRNFVAVKKLDGVIQDNEKEFKTEVNVIGQTHHKNLVRLLGFCDEGQHRMLVYEFLSNGTLASFLFGDLRPSWSQRIQIALGIAKGLLYLHEECCAQIIHCDIKPQNILLDDYYNARISDFGLAKLLMINQSQTNTGIRGTRGYVAPEWFRYKPITVKVDVYSFGVLLLEIISCQKCLEDLEIGGEEKAILTDWVCDCFQEGKLDALVENDMEALNDWKKLERFAMVGIWCIQEDPSLRPTMSKVTQMLEGIVEITVPPSPFSTAE